MTIDRSRIDAVSQGYDGNPARSWSLHADCYRDPDFLQLKQEQVCQRSWQFLCHQEKLREHAVHHFHGLLLDACRDGCEP